ncbi:DUF4369 domain-containing protein [Flagellimonas alvinocaridis]|uniref:DUF4369 domain-containing protein n=1 Tax=Flagellimonas alvinocaridis TaxID=2530200 RepID=A0A4S8RHB9_9FLAO|nr:DUF4369 domain-containing protein [Allomuricauda alvinocaridis]THV57737.1 DUF4369 domain-containing protein [Allomuricauda alvinocaridis]
MKRLLFVLSLGMLVLSCEKNTESTMTISGNVKGLKKGTLYLQQFKDSTLVALDSLEIEGDGAFTFSEELESPDIFYLYLKKQDNNDINDRITFFGEPGQITINTTWKTFDTDPKISGSASHDKFSEFNEMISKFNIRDIALAQQASLPEFQGDSTALDSLQKLADINLVRRYRYALNFGLNNGDSYATPYIMMAEASDANPKYLDSVYNALTPEVATSKYGKVFQDFLSKQD